MKGLILLADGFEDCEAITTIDVLRRSQLEVTTVSVNPTLEVKTQSGLKIMADQKLTDITPDQYDFLILPGGRAVFQVLDHLKEIDDLIETWVRSNKWIAAICAAPLLIGKKGFFDQCEYTCFPTVQSRITKGHHSDQAVVVSNRFITAKSMYYTIDFSLKIIETFQGITQREKIERSLKGLA